MFISSHEVDYCRFGSHVWSNCDIILHICGVNFFEEEILINGGNLLAFNATCGLNG